MRLKKTVWPRSTACMHSCKQIQMRKAFILCCEMLLHKGTAETGRGSWTHVVHREGPTGTQPQVSLPCHAAPGPTTCLTNTPAEAIGRSVPPLRASASHRPQTRCLPCCPPYLVIVLPVEQPGCPRHAGPPGGGGGGSNWPHFLTYPFVSCFQHGDCPYM